MAYGQSYSAPSGLCCPIPSTLFTPTSRMNRCGTFNDFIAGFIPTRKSKRISFWASARRQCLLPLWLGSPWWRTTASSTRHWLNSPIVEALAQLHRVPRDLSYAYRATPRRCFGTTPEFWIDLQAHYDLDIADRTAWRRYRTRGQTSRSMTSAVSQAVVQRRSRPSAASS